MPSQQPINQDSPIVPAFGESLPISRAVDEWYNNWHKKRDSTTQRVSFPTPHRTNVTSPKLFLENHMTSLHSPQSTTPSAQEVFTIDFGKMSPERDPRATESSYNDDFGPRTPDRSEEEQFVIHFGTREDECASRALSPETPKEDFVIDFASNLTLHSPTPSRENFDFGSHPEEDFNIDFGRNDHPGSPMEGIIVDFGPRSPSQSPLNIVIDFKNHESTTPIVESPREDFVIEFHDAPDSPRGPAAPPSPLDIMIDFKDVSDSPRGPATPPSPLDIVINFKDAPDSPRGPATPPSPLDILINFKDHSSPITPQETFLFDFTQAPDSPRGPASPTLSPYLIHFGTHTVNAPRTPPVTPSSGPGELDVDFHLPSPWRLFEPAEDVVAMSQLDYDLQLSQVAANMEASMEPAAGMQSPLHPDFLGIGPESSPSMEPANLVVRSPVIRAALRYGYKTGPEKRSLPTFIDQYEEIPAHVMEKCEDAVACSMAEGGATAERSAEHLRTLCEEDRRRHRSELDFNLNVMNLILPLLNDSDYLVQ